MIKDIEKELALLLISNVENKQMNLTYKEVAAILTQKLGRPIDAYRNLNKPLETVARACADLNLPIITVRVIRSNGTTSKMAGEGFHRIACELKPEYKSWAETDAWKNENKLVRECKDWGKLKSYVLGEEIKAVPKAVAPVVIEDPFAVWLGKSTKLAESSVDKYARAVRTISQEMLNQKIISKPILEMDSFELDIAMALIAGNAYFVDKNKRGNHMYSNALKQFRYYRNAEGISEGSSDTYVAAIANDTSIPETERTAIVQSRVGQGQFRKQLIDKYRGSCVITGINHPKLLVASHIKPWAASNNQERLQVDNGLLLSATYDRLFDSGLITFDRVGKIYLSSFIGPENEKKLHLQTGTQYPLLITSKMQQFLEYHSDVVFVK
jgi:hypothetical protein